MLGTGSHPVSLTSFLWAGAGAEQLPDEVRPPQHHGEEQEDGPGLDGLLPHPGGGGGSQRVSGAVAPQLVHLRVTTSAQQPLQPAVQVAQRPHQREGRQHAGQVGAQPRQVVGHVQHGAEAVVDGGEGGVQHHADRGERLHDALDGLEGAAAALLRLLHEAAGGHLVPGAQTVVAPQAEGSAPVGPTPEGSAPIAVGAVAAVQRAAVRAVGGAVGAVGAKGWTVALLDGTGGHRWGHPGQDRRSWGGRGARVRTQVCRSVETHTHTVRRRGVTSCCCCQ